MFGGKLLFCASLVARSGPWRRPVPRVPKPFIRYRWCYRRVYYPTGGASAVWSAKGARSTASAAPIGVDRRFSL